MLFWVRFGVLFTVVGVVWFYDYVVGFMCFGCLCCVLLILCLWLMLGLLWVYYLMLIVLLILGRIGVSLVAWAVGFDLCVCC